jgi:hypothetical protein
MAAQKIPRLPKARNVDVTRDEFNRVIEILNRRSEIIEEHGAVIASVQRDLETQFKRIAQLQQELDAVKKAVAKIVAV